MLSSCSPPQDLFSPTNSPKTTPPTTPPSISTPQEVIDVARVEHSVARAGDALKHAFAGFLEREQLEFTQELPKALWLDIWSLQESFAQAATAFNIQDLWTNLATLFPLIITLIFITLYTILSAQTHALTMWFQARQYSRLGKASTKIWRGLILILGSASPVLLCILLSYFPIRAIFGSTCWTILLTQVFFVLLIWHVCSGGIMFLFGLNLLGIEDEHANTLQTYTTRSLQCVLFFLLGIEILKAFAYRKDATALLTFSLEVTLALLPCYLLRIKSSVLAMFPVYSDSSVYVFLRRTLDRYFVSVLVLTAVLLIMRAFGYMRASTFILTRSYGIFLILVLSFLGLAKLRSILDARILKLDNEDPQHDLLESIKQLITAAIILGLGMVILRMLTFDVFVLILLKIPLLTIQTVDFSIFNVISAALIISTSVLCSKILRAILNDRIYPSLHVDVGVAYAMNTILNYVFVFVGFFMVLIALGVNLSALTVVVASLSVGIGFGLQNVTENLISGFIILFGRAVRKGDFITVNNIYGRVEAVGARSVVVRTMDNYDMLIPSKDLVGNTIINWTYRDTIVREHIAVGVSYKAHPREIEKLLLDAATQHQHILETPKAEVWFVGFGDNSINFELLVYYDCTITNSARLKGQFYYFIWDALAHANVEIPFPQRDLHIRSITPQFPYTPSAPKSSKH